MTKIQKLRNQTYHEAKSLLEEYGKVCIIRPTGFGKTGILTRFLSDYKNIVYLYPADIIRQTVLNFYYIGEVPEDEIIPNVRFITYAKLVRMSEDEMRELGDIDCIIADECHRLGAERTVDSMSALLDIYPDVDLIGATATPERMDLIDEISMFFDNRVVSQYTLHDAFQDKVLQRPYYCFCGYGESDLKDVEAATKLEIEKMDVGRENAEKLLRSRLIEIAHLSKMDNVIRNTCYKYVPDTNYMKFIVFFSKIASMYDKEDEVVEWFQKAYPTHEIRIVKVSSEDAETSNNVHRLEEMTYEDGVIDLIFSCDMLNMGYHVDSLTGIVMYRGTESGIVFAQQLGRVLSSGHSKAGIVFDVVDNIHREAMYEVLGHESDIIVSRRERLQELQRMLDAGIVMNGDEETEYKELLRAFNDDNGRWWVHANDLLPMDLIATGYEATYRELIAKVVAEPVSMRCRQAWARWIEKGGDESTKTVEAILGQKAPNNVPLEPFCRLKSVSVDAVLKEMGVV